MIISSFIKAFEFPALTLKWAIMINILSWDFFESFIDLAGFS